MGQQPAVYKVEISAKTIIFTVVFILSILLLWVIRGLLLSLFVAFIIMSAVKPPVSFLEKKGVNRRLAAIMVFAILVVLAGLLLTWVVPPLVVESALLIKQLPSMLEAASPAFVDYINIESLFQYAPNITNQAFGIIRSVFSNVMFVLTTLFFSLYFTFEEGFIKNILTQFFHEKKAKKAAEVFERTEKRLGGWLLGQLVLMIAVGCMTYIGLSLIGVRYALPLSIIAGLLEVVPSIGPTISTVPAFIVGVTQSSFLGFSTIALFLIVQQLENNFLVPYIMKKVTGLNPIVILISLIIGGQLFGVIGMLLSIPFTLFIETILIEILKTEPQPK
ncbi:MAG: AI-2E family transporter [Patescibacteria group bacterium]